MVGNKSDFAGSRIPWAETNKPPELSIQKHSIGSATLEQWIVCFQNLRALAITTPPFFSCFWMACLQYLIRENKDTFVFLSPLVSHCSSLPESHLPPSLYSYFPSIVYCICWLCNVLTDLHRFKIVWKSSLKNAGIGPGGSGASVLGKMSDFIMPGPEGSPSWAKLRVSSTEVPGDGVPTGLSRLLKGSVRGKLGRVVKRFQCS